MRPSAQRVECHETTLPLLFEGLGREVPQQGASAGVTDDRYKITCVEICRKGRDGHGATSSTINGHPSCVAAAATAYDRARGPDHGRASLSPKSPMSSRAAVAKACRFGGKGENIDSVVAALDAMKGAVFSGSTATHYNMRCRLARRATPSAAHSGTSTRSALIAAVAELAGIGPGLKGVPKLLTAFSRSPSIHRTRWPSRRPPTAPGHCSNWNFWATAMSNGCGRCGQAAPAARLIIDANESWNEAQLREYMPMLIDLRGCTDRTAAAGQR